MAAAAPASAAKYASIVIDMDTQKVLHEKEADAVRHPASLTKVMTLYMVFDALDAGTLKLNERIPVSKFAAKQQPSKLGLKAGGTIKVEDGIRALVTKSANDVAVVFAEKLGGSESKFATKMNAKARALGLTDTVFKNASGLPNKAQVTTARDMAKLAEAVFRDHKDRYNYFALPSFTWNKRKYENHNRLLKQVQGVDGIKTGFTNASGYNLMASANREGHRVIAVMLGGSTGRSRDAHVADLLEAAFLEINGAPSQELDDVRARIAFGVGREMGADDLAAAQLAKFAALDATPAAVAAGAAVGALVEAVSEGIEGSTEEGEGEFETAVAEGETAEGDAEQAANSESDPIGNLIQTTTAAPADAIGALISSWGGTPAVVSPSPLQPPPPPPGLVTLSTDPAFAASLPASQMPTDAIR